MTRRASTLAAEEKASPALVRALAASEAALAACEAQLTQARATVERQARDLAALQLRKPRPDAPPTPVPPAASVAADPAEIAAAHAEIESLKADLAALKASTSWRVTSPLRSVTGLVRR